MKLTRTTMLQFFLIMAFIAAQISPACAFISGKNNLLQICAADGSLKTIKVSDKYSPSKKQDHQSKHKLKDQCAFCYSNSHIIKTLIKTPITKIIPAQNYRIISAGTIAPKSLKLHKAQPRAPPILS